MSVYAIDGTMNVTVVPGTSTTGLYAPDGSINVVQVNGSSYTGRYAPCGAWNVFKSTGASGHNHSSGAWNISQFGSFILGTKRVTVVSGVIT